MISKKFAVFAVFITLLIGVGSVSDLAATEIAVVVSYDNAATREMILGFREYLQSKSDGVDVEFYHLNKSVDKAEQVGSQINAKGGTDLVFAVGSFALGAVSRIQDIPVVAGMILKKKDIEKYPNVTGVALEFPIKTQLDWISRFLPEAKKIGVLYNPSENGKIVETAKKIARKNGLEIIAQGVEQPNNLPAALKLLSNNTDVLWGINDKTVLNKKTAKNVLLFSFRNRIPFVGLSVSWVKAGAFYALDRDYKDIGKQCGEMSLKILQGAKVKSVKPEFPRKVAYSFNTKTAKRMKVKVATNLIKGAKIKF